MKLATKLMAIVLAGVLVLVALEGYVSIQRSVSLFDREMEDHALLLGHALGPVVHDAWLEEGEAAARVVLVEASQRAQGLGLRLIPAALGRAEVEWLEESQWSALEQGADVSVKLEPPGESGVRHTFVPVFTDGRPLGVIELTESLATLRAYQRESLLRTVGLIALMALVGTVAMRAVGLSMLGRPLRLLADKARRVGRGDLEGRVELGGDDELRELASALNSMCEDLSRAREETREEHAAKLEAVEHSRHHDRLHTIGRLAAGVAHELGTPLNVIAGRADMLANADRPAEEIAEFGRIIKSQAKRMDGIIRELLQFGRRRSVGKTPTQLDALVRSSLEVIAPLAREHGVEVHLASNDPARVAIDPAQIQQVVTNLVLNAVQASARGGRIDVRVDRASGKQDWIRLTVRDFGEGMTDDTMSRLFDPFFTTKDVGKGTGLGLSISHGIVADHGGRIEVSSTLGEGSEFEVYLPAGVDV